jgi:hypothetical protein
MDCESRKSEPVTSNEQKENKKQELSAFSNFAFPFSLFQFPITIFHFPIPIFHNRPKAVGSSVEKMSI